MHADRGMPGTAVAAAHEFFRKGDASAEGWSLLIARGRGWESAYRDRWRHDKVVRSTHGVNCTGSCSWNVYVKDGLITWESAGRRLPEHRPGPPEPRASRLPARRVVLLVHVLAGPPQVPLRARQPARALARGARHGGRPGRGVRAGGGRGRLPRRARPRRLRALRLGGGERADRGGDGARDPRARPRPRRRLHPDPRDVAGLLRGRQPLPVADRRAHDHVLRLVRRPAAGVAAGVRRPDRRARVGRLVGRGLPDRVGHQPADHPHARTRTS